MNTEMNQKKKYWKGHIIKWQRSGLSRSRYCKDENISYWSFRDWSKKLEELESSKVVRVPHEVYQGEQAIESSIEIVIHENLSIRIKKGYDCDTLRSLLVEFGVQV